MTLLGKNTPKTPLELQKKISFFSAKNWPKSGFKVEMGSNKVGRWIPREKLPLKSVSSRKKIFDPKKRQGYSLDAFLGWKIFHSLFSIRVWIRGFSDTPNTTGYLVFGLDTIFDHKWLHRIFIAAFPQKCQIQQISFWWHLKWTKFLTSGGTGTSCGVDIFSQKFTRVRRKIDLWKLSFFNFHKKSISTK